MILGARTGLWGSGLPIGCRRVKCLVSSGSQYIDTGIIPNGKDIIACLYEYISSGRVFSARDVSYKINAFEHRNNNNQSTVFVYFGSERYTPDTHDPITGERYAVLNGTTGRATLNDELIGTFTPTDANCVNTMTLFASHSASTWISEFSSSKIKWFTITRNGVLIRDMIPVVKDNVGYMYDRVSKQLFGNQGTGAFSWEE